MKNNNKTKNTIKKTHLILFEMEHYSKNSEQHDYYEKKKKERYMSDFHF